MIEYAVIAYRSFNNIFNNLMYSYSYDYAMVAIIILLAAALILVLRGLWKL